MSISNPQQPTRHVGEWLAICVFPWMGLAEPQVSLGWTFAPASNAAQEHPTFQSAIVEATSYFFDSHRVLDVDDPSAPTRLVPIEPTVVIAKTQGDFEAITDATLVLFFATVYGNTLHRYANGTNFQHFFMLLTSVGSGLQRTARTMFGSRNLGTQSAYSIEIKPFWCGDWHEPDERVLALAEAAFRSTEVNPIRRSLEALLPATYDSDEYDARLQQSLYVLAFERLLARPDQKQHDRSKKQRALAQKLLASVLNGMTMFREVVTADEPPPFDVNNLAILDVMKMVRDNRHEFWHPDATGSGSMLTAQTAVSPLLLAFRALATIVLAAMSEAARRPLEPPLVAFVAAVEHWLIERDAVFRMTADEAENRFAKLFRLYYIRNAITVDTLVRDESP